MTLLITGCAGFIGSNLAEVLTSKNQRIIGIDKDYTGQHRLKNIIQNKSMSIDTINFIKPEFAMIWDDVKNLSKYEYALRNINTIYHLAAASDIKRSLNDTSWDLTENIVGTWHVLEFMRKKDIKNIIFTSTSALYGEDAPLPTTENFCCYKPISLYAASKICAEILIHAFTEIYDIKATVFRFGNVIGKHQHRGVIVDFMNKLSKNPNSLEILGDGKQIKSYFHVSDCINAMLEIPAKNKNKFDVFNIATYDYKNVTTVANIISNELKLMPKYYYTGGDRGWKGDVPKIMLSIKKALDTGWKPKYKCEEAIRKTVRELKNDFV